MAFDEHVSRKQFLQFCSHWLWPFTFRSQICCISYSCPAICFH